MSKLPAFADRKWPWTQGEVDEEKAAKLIYDLRADLEKATEKKTTDKTEIDRLTGELQEAKAAVEAAATAEPAKDAEIGRLTRQVRELETKAGEISPVAQLQIDKLEIALSTGLSKSQAQRLVGKTREELEADAKEYAKDLGIETPGEDDGETPSGPPQRQPRSASEFKTGNSKVENVTPGSVQQTLDELGPL